MPGPKGEPFTQNIIVGRCTARQTEARRVIRPHRHYVELLAAGSISPTVTKSVRLSGGGDVHVSAFTRFSSIENVIHGVHIALSVIGDRL